MASRHLSLRSFISYNSDSKTIRLERTMGARSKGQRCVLEGLHLDRGDQKEVGLGREVCKRGNKNEKEITKEKKFRQKQKGGGANSWMGLEGGKGDVKSTGSKKDPRI